MENKNNVKNEKELILSGVCPKNHDTNDRVCRACYEDLLKKYNNLNNGNKKNKSPWHTW